MQSNNYLYIPIELFNREMNGALVLAVTAANKGWFVFLGSKKEIISLSDRLPKGVFYLKSIVPGELEQLKRIINNGHKISTLDAEGLVLDNDELGIGTRYSDKSIELASKIFFWGNAQLKQAKSIFPFIDEKSYVVGSPIFDYWRYLKLTQKNKVISKKKVILVATSFGLVNHISGLQHTSHLKISSAGIEGYKKYQNEIFRVRKIKEILYPKYKEMVVFLAEKFSEYEIVLRPHPAENIDDWKKIAQSSPNITFNTGGSISSTLMNSDLIIHFNSTSAVEACFYGKHIITYLPPDCNEYLDTINKNVLDLSISCSSLDELLLTIQNINWQKTPDQSSIANIVQDFDSSVINRSSIDILESLEDIKISSKENFPNLLRRLTSKKKAISKIKFRVIWVIAWVDHITNLFSGKYAPRRMAYVYGNLKQFPVKKDEIQQNIDSISNSLGHNSKSFSVDMISKKSFILKQIKS